MPWRSKPCPSTRSRCCSLTMLPPTTLPHFWRCCNRPCNSGRFRQSSRGGPARAQVMGIRAARGEFVLFLNDDAIMEPDGLRVHLKPIYVCRNTGCPFLDVSNCPLTFALGSGATPSPIRSCVRLWFPASGSSVREGIIIHAISVPPAKPCSTPVCLMKTSRVSCGARRTSELGHRLAHLEPPACFREGCAAEHRHHLNVTDFGRMFRVRGGAR